MGFWLLVSLAIVSWLFGYAVGLARERGRELGIYRLRIAAAAKDQAVSDLRSRLRIGATAGEAAARATSVPRPGTN
jgi:hypothetical protein